MIRAKAILLPQLPHLVPNHPSIVSILFRIVCTLSSQSLQSLQSSSIFSIRQPSSGSPILNSLLLVFDTELDTFTPAVSTRRKRAKRPTSYFRYSSSPSSP